MMTNFHTHTSRCRHAWGTDEDYVKEAIKHGYKILGFADHACWPFLDHKVMGGYTEKLDTPLSHMRDSVLWAYDRHESNMRMGAWEFGDYARSIKHLREKYQHSIEIRLGLEAEYDPKYMDWMLDLCVQYNVDYLILGCHNIRGMENGIYSGSITKDQLQEYVDTCINGLETGMYAYLAHPEIFMRSRSLTLDEDVEDAFLQIAKACARMDIPVEYNCAGMMANMYSDKERYPHHRFWEIAAQQGCKAVIGMDAHLPECLDKQYYDQAREYLKTLDLEIVEDIGRINFKALKEAKERLSKAANKAAESTEHESLLKKLTREGVVLIFGK